MTTLIARILLPVFLVCLKMTHQNIWIFKKNLRLVSSPNRVLVALYDRYFAEYGAYVGLSSNIEGEPCFPHGPYGVFISSMASIGKNAVIFQHVTIGSNSLIDAKHPGGPSIGSDVYIGAGAKIIGNIQIGGHCRIGANAVVYQDIPENSVAVQSPTRIIQKVDLDNRFVRYQNGKKVYYMDGQWIPCDESAHDHV